MLILRASFVQLRGGGFKLSVDCGARNRKDATENKVCYN
jgi:hypothetical protein